MTTTDISRIVAAAIMTAGRHRSNSLDINTMTINIVNKMLSFQVETEQKYCVIEEKK